MSRSLAAVLNESNPNKLADAGRLVRLGTALSLIARKAVVTVVAGTGIGALPTNAKAATILRCFVRAGGVSGYFTPIAGEAPPATTQVAISPGGDLLFLAADAVTSAEVIYLAEEGEVITERMTVAASAGLFAQGRRAARVLSATVVAGVTPGVVLVPDDRTTAAGAGEVCLTLLGTGVVFNAGNVVAGTVDVTYIAQPGFGTALAIGAELDTAVDF